MSILNGNTIIAPISLDDVKTILGAYSTNDLGTLCKHQSINKWAKHKPIRYNAVGVLTEAMRQSANQGLIAQAFPLPQNCQMASIPEVSEWGYNKPTGGESSPYRLADFVNDENPTISGYNHNAVAPSGGFEDSDVLSHRVDEARVSFTFKWGESSYEGIGNTTGIDIPMSQLQMVSGSPINDGTWRIAVAMFKPVGNGYEVKIFAGEECIPKSVTAGTDISKILPVVGNDTSCVELLQSTSTSRQWITCIAFLSKSLVFNNNGSTKWFSVNDDNHFFMPKGGMFKMRATLAIEFIQGEMSEGRWAFVSNGAEVGGSSFIPQNESAPYISLTRPSTLGATNQNTNMSAVFEITQWPDALLEGTDFKCSFFGYKSDTATLYKDNGSGTFAQVSGNKINGTGRYKVTATQRTTLVNYLNSLTPWSPNAPSGVGTYTSVKFGVSFNVAGETKTFSLSRNIRIIS